MAAAPAGASEKQNQYQKARSKDVTNFMEMCVNVLNEYDMDSGWDRQTERRNCMKRGGVLAGGVRAQIATQSNVKNVQSLEDRQVLYQQLLTATR